MIELIGAVFYVSVLALVCYLIYRLLKGFLRSKQDKKAAQDYLDFRWAKTTILEHAESLSKCSGMSISEAILKVLSEDYDSVLWSIRGDAAQPSSRTQESR